VGLSVLISQAIGDFRAAGIEDPIDLYSLGRLHFSLGDFPESIACFEQALSKRMPAEWQEVIYTNLAWAYKRTRSLERAAEVWQHLLKEKFPFNLRLYEELAKYYEHKEKDYARAMQIVDRARESLNLESQLSSNFNYQRALASLQYRRTRLERKIRNQELKN
jgi:tetratricopeptide (TPR) repeat protein